MKRVILVLLPLVLISISCRNRSKSQEKEVERIVSPQEQMAVEAVKADFRNLSESSKRLKNLPFERGLEGEFKFTDKARMNKPDYLLDPSRAATMLTLEQKYRFVSMLKVDCIIARLYGMPEEGFKDAIGRLAVEINDSAFSDFASADSLPEEERVSEFLDKEYAKGRARFFWESIAAGLIEQLYICTKDLDSFLAMFDDQTAADVTYDFVVLHDGVTSLLETDPDMVGLNNVLLPLYVINATCVEELRGQLEQVKEDITNARNYLSK